MATDIIKQDVNIISGTKGIFVEITLITAAVLLPALCHFTNLPVKILLPMHLPVIAAGLFCGRKAGLTAGIAAVAISGIISGMPQGFTFLKMLTELAIMGYIAGFSVEKLRLSPALAVLCSVFAGRVFLIASFFIFVKEIPFSEYLTATILVGLPAAAVQVVLLSAIAKLIKK